MSLQEKIRERSILRGKIVISFASSLMLAFSLYTGIAGLNTKFNSVSAEPMPQEHTFSGDFFEGIIRTINNEAVQRSGEFPNLVVEEVELLELHDLKKGEVANINGIDCMVNLIIVEGGEVTIFVSPTDGSTPFKFVI